MTAYEREIEEYGEVGAEPSPVVRAVLEDSITALNDTGIADLDWTLEEVLDLTDLAVEILPAISWGTLQSVKGWLALDGKERNLILGIKK